MTCSGLTPLHLTWAATASKKNFVLLHFRHWMYARADGRALDKYVITIHFLIRTSTWLHSTYQGGVKAVNSAKVLFLASYENSLNLTTQSNAHDHLHGVVGANLNNVRLRWHNSCLHLYRYLVSLTYGNGRYVYPATWLSSYSQICNT